jgi:hypothetical protein
MRGMTDSYKTHIVVGMMPGSRTFAVIFDSEVFPIPTPIAFSIGSQEILSSLQAFTKTAAVQINVFRWQNFEC